MVKASVINKYANLKGMILTLRDYIQAYKNKITRKLFGVVHLHTKKTKKGVVLISLMTAPFVGVPGKNYTDPHPNYFACEEMARSFLVRGYDVDVIDWDNDTFIPKKKYIACIDSQRNLERLAGILGSECKKIMYVTASRPAFQNEAEEKRIDALEKRRGVRFSVKRVERPSENARFADFLQGSGNKSVRDTYGDLSDKIVPIPIASMEFYNYPEHKDFTEARKHFLWFGGGGAILKGLDLVIEAFAEMPEYTITLVGPAAFEKEFVAEYQHELALPNVERYPRPVIRAGGNMVGNKKLEDVMKDCVAVVFPSASEGHGASVVQAMQAGLIPVVTAASGIEEQVAHLIEKPTVEAVKNAVRKIANTDPQILAKESRRIWEFARTNHSKEMYAKRFGNFIDNVLKL